MTTLALLGCAHIHTPGFVRALQRRQGDLRVKWVHDHDLVRATRWAAEFPDGMVGPDLEAILSDDDVDAVVVCTETDRHADVVLPAAAAGKDLFVEKPLGFRSDDAFTMADAVEAAGVRFQTGYFMRGDGKVRWLRDRVREGAFGKITRVRASNCHSGALGGWFDGEWRWMADPTVSGCGGFGDLGTHVLDLLLGMFGDVATGTASIDNGTARYPGCDETGEGLLRFRSGTIATLAAGWDDLADPVGLTISGTALHATIVDGSLRVVREPDGPVEVVEGLVSVPAGFEAFLDAVTGVGAPELVGVREAAYRGAVMEALYAGSASGTWTTPRTA
ncbi:MAG: Gfo/Idh/MocA family protein [Armatimonadota bacterium]